MKPLFERYNQAMFYFYPMVSSKRPDEDKSIKDCELVFVRKEKELVKEIHLMFIDGGVLPFEIPWQFEADADLIMQSRHKETSKEYQDKVYLMWPDLKKGLDRRFGRELFLDFKVTNNLSNDLEMPEL